MRKAILYSGGVINLYFASHYVNFGKPFSWMEVIPKLFSMNQGVIQIENVIISFIQLYFSAISIILAKYEKIDIYAKSIIIFISAFYIIRVILGYLYFTFSYEELALELISLTIAVGYLSLLFIYKLDHATLMNE